MKNSFLLIILTIFFLPAGFSQQMSVYGFYKESGTPPEDFIVLANLDPVSGTFYKMDTIDQIYGYSLGSSTYDQTNKYYIFKGVDTGNVMKLISRDVVNQTTVYAPANNYTINDFQYDMNTQTLFALGNYKSDSVLIDTMSGIYLYDYASRFLAIDIENSEAEELSLLPNLTGFPVGNSSFDSNNGRYIVCGYDSLFNTRLFVIDALTGQVASQVELSLSSNQYLNELEYNNEDNNLYGIFRDNNQGTMSMASVNLETGQINQLTVLENAFAFTPGASVFDQTSQSFIFYYLTASNAWHMLVYNVPGAEITSDVAMQGYFTEIEVDNSAYAMLKYGTTSVAPKESFRDMLSIFPNPASSGFNIYCEDQFTTIKIFDLTGKEIFISHCDKTNEDFVHGESFVPGIYFVRVETDDRVHTSKLVIE